MQSKVLYDPATLKNQIIIVFDNEEEAATVIDLLNNLKNTKGGEQMLMLTQKEKEDLISILNARINMCQDQIERHSRGDWGQSYYEEQIDIARNLKHKFHKFQPLEIS